MEKRSIIRWTRLWKINFKKKFYRVDISNLLHRAKCKQVDFFFFFPNTKSLNLVINYFSIWWSKKADRFSWIFFIFLNLIFKIYFSELETSWRIFNKATWGIFLNYFVNSLLPICQYCRIVRIHFTMPRQHVYDCIYCPSCVKRGWKGFWWTPCIYSITHRLLNHTWALFVTNIVESCFVLNFCKLK